MGQMIKANELCDLFFPKQGVGGVCGYMSVSVSATALGTLKRMSSRPGGWLLFYLFHIYSPLFEQEVADNGNIKYLK